MSKAGAIEKLRIDGFRLERAVYCGTMERIRMAFPDGRILVIKDKGQRLEDIYNQYKNIMCQAECIEEPRGDHGLEGYLLNESYRYQKARYLNGKPCVRVFPTNGKYFESCSPNVFKKYFMVSGG